MLLFLVIVVLTISAVLHLVNEDMFDDSRISYRTYDARKNYTYALCVICTCYIVVVLVKFVLTFIINLF